MSVTRRDFLKLGAAAVAAATINPLKCPVSANGSDVRVPEPPTVPHHLFPLVVWNRNKEAWYCQDIHIGNTPDWIRIKYQDWMDDV